MQEHDCHINLMRKVCQLQQDFISTALPSELAQVAIRQRKEGLSILGGPKGNWDLNNFGGEENDGLNILGEPKGNEGLNILLQTFPYQVLLFSGRIKGRKVYFFFSCFSDCLQLPHKCHFIPILNTSTPDTIQNTVKVLTNIEGPACTAVVVNPKQIDKILGNLYMYYKHSYLQQMATRSLINIIFLCRILMVRVQ